MVNNRNNLFLFLVHLNIFTTAEFRNFIAHAFQLKTDSHDELHVVCGKETSSFIADPIPLLMCCYA